MSLYRFPSQHWHTVATHRQQSCKGWAKSSLVAIYGRYELLVHTSPEVWHVLYHILYCQVKCREPIIIACKLPITTPLVRKIFPQILAIESIITTLLIPETPHLRFIYCPHDNRQNRPFCLVFTALTPLKPIYLFDLYMQVYCDYSPFMIQYMPSLREGWKFLKQVWPSSWKTEGRLTQGDVNKGNKLWQHP